MSPVSDGDKSDPEGVRAQFADDFQRLIELATRFAATADPEKAGELYRALMVGLPRHFAEEEASGGLFDRIVERAPGLDSAVESLRDEHTRLLQQLYEMPPSASSSGAVRRRFVAGMYAHEFCEGQALRDAQEDD